MPLIDAAHVREERIRVLPPCYLVAALAAGWGLSHLWPLFTIALAARWLGGVLTLFGLALMMAAFREQVRHKTDPNPWKETRHLVTSGPYAWSRNPIYLADLFLQTGIGLALNWVWAVVLLPATWGCLRFLVIAKEEPYLVRQFGEEYAAYAGRVARWFGRPPRR
ncbi:MAG: methyltransferase family protein [Thermoplasmatota archaeon]